VDFGLFVDVGGYNGLLHRSTLPPDLDFHACFPPGSPIRVRVMKIDGSRISLALASAPV
jgi:ribosomal protein S1